MNNYADHPPRCFNENRNTVEKALRLERRISSSFLHPQSALYSNHTETIIKYFVTNPNNHKTQNRSGHLVYRSSERKALQKQHFMISFTNSEKITTVNKIKN